jgi:hypothetical protein
MALVTLHTEQLTLDTPIKTYKPQSSVLIMYMEFNLGTLHIKRIKTAKLRDIDSPQNCTPSKV